MSARGRLKDSPRIRIKWQIQTHTPVPGKGAWNWIDFKKFPPFSPENGGTKEGNLIEGVLAHLKIF